MSPLNVLCSVGTACYFRCRAHRLSLFPPLEHGERIAHPSVRASPEFDKGRTDASAPPLLEGLNPEAKPLCDLDLD